MTSDSRRPDRASRPPTRGPSPHGDRAGATGSFSAGRPIAADPASRRTEVPFTSPSTPPTPTPSPTPRPPRDDQERRPGRRRIVVAAAALAALLTAGAVGGVVGASSHQTDGEQPLSSATADADDGPVEAVARRVLPSVVQLKGGSGEGSGVVLSTDGLILTNAHVLQASQSSGPRSGNELGQPSGPAGLVALFQDGNSAPVRVVGTDTTADLAVVRAENVSDLTPLQVGDSSALQVGQDVVAVGSPLGLSGTVTTGIVSAIQRPVTSSGAQAGQASVIDAVQTDAAINPGNSGGALVDMQGRLIGITSAIASLSSSGPGGRQSGSIGLGFAIPINQAARIADELARTGSATRAVLGVGIADAQTAGAQLSQVAPDGPARSAGLGEGDIVVRLNDRVINDANSLVAGIRAQEPGAAVTLTVVSGGGAPRQVPVTLGSERAP